MSHFNNRHKATSLMMSEVKSRSNMIRVPRRYSALARWEYPETFGWPWAV